MANAKLKLRELSVEEREHLQRIIRSRKTATRLVERAKIVWLASQGQRIAEIIRQLGVSRATVMNWIQRFNAHGLAGLQDLQRSGRPATYTPEEVAEVIATALTDSQQLDLPFASWTLDRLETHLNDVRGIAIKRSRIDELLRAEGLRWRQQETWFGHRVDPDFAAKRGRLKRFTRHRRKEA